MIKLNKKSETLYDNLDHSFDKLSILMELINDTDEL